MTSIITGSDGFIGRKLIEKLSKSEIETLTLKRKDGDLSKISLNNLIEDSIKIDRVFHLAAKTFVPHAWEKPEKFIQENISSTLNVLNYCRLRNVPLIYISAYIYGDQSILPIKENTKIKASNPYAQSKYLCEQICKYYVEVFSLDITILRPFNVYGPGQNKNFLIPQIIDQIKNNKELIVNSFNPKRDYIHVDDLADALVAASLKITGLQIYNIGSGSSISVKGIIDLIEEIIDKPLGFKEKNITRNNELMDVVADISEATASLNWNPQLNLKSGLTQILLQEGLCV
jgi:nucleoside-diphosphate-sugar epimerase|tara:strand:+ start:320 stop:1183 length:864 start_codon:yes stop_codon:yes gene_type:complete